MEGNRADFSVGAGDVAADISANGWPLRPASHPCEPRPPSTPAASGEIVVSAMRWSSAAPDPRPPSLEPAPDAPRPLVVWADDHPDTRELVSQILADQFDIVAVADGAAALAAVHQHLPDLVLCDVMMPGLDGIGLLTELRADPRTRTIPVILLSARAGSEASVEGLDAGADDYLMKPFSPRELIARVRTHIALNRSRRAGAIELERTNRELERANRELQAFSYQVSHDLRAPARAIEHFSRLLLGDHACALDDDARRLLSRIHSGTRRMTSLIDDLLALSQAGQGQLRRESVDVSELSRRIVTGLRARDPQRTVDVRVADGLSTVGDGGLVLIALENLLGNAWKFTSKRTHAVIAVEREDSGVFAIRDNGVGFDMAHSEHLFEPFHRLHSSSDFEGTGIGLSIVRRVVERHGGHVWAHGIVDGGATIRFTLEPEPA